MYLAWLSKIRYTWPGFRSVASVGAEVPEPQQPTMLRKIVLINSFHWSWLIVTIYLFQQSSIKMFRDHSNHFEEIANFMNAQTILRGTKINLKKYKNIFEQITKILLKPTMIYLYCYLYVSYVSFISTCYFHKFSCFW